MAQTSSKVHIAQQNLDPRTNIIQALTITAHYGDQFEVEPIILLRPGAVSNDDTYPARDRAVS